MRRHNTFVGSKRHLRRIIKHSDLLGLHNSPPAAIDPKVIAERLRDIQVSTNPSTETNLVGEGTSSNPNEESFRFIARDEQIGLSVACRQSHAV